MKAITAAASGAVKTLTQGMSVFPFGRWVNRKSPGEAVQAGAIAPIQPELSLDAVKPLRNDLSDADLELVPARPEPASSGPAPSAASEGSAPEVAAERTV